MELAAGTYFAALAQDGAVLHMGEASSDLGMILQRRKVRASKVLGFARLTTLHRAVLHAEPKKSQD